MCEEKLKVCKYCGKELPISEFHKQRLSKDGYQTVCKACKANRPVKDFVNSKLANFSPRELIDELKGRGYHGSLVYTEKHVINI